MFSSVLSRIYLTRHKQDALSFPRTLDIEPSNACNLRCPYCPATEAVHKIQRENMSWDLFTKIADELYEHPVKVWLQVGGEPLLHPRLADMVSYLKAGKSQVQSVSFSTNGTLLTGEKSKRLILAGLDRILFSVDASNASSYARRRVGGNYEQLVDNILEFIAIRKGLNLEKPKIRIQMIAFQDALHEIDDFLRFWADKLGPHDKAEVKPYDDWGGQMPDLGNLQNYNNVSFQTWKTRFEPPRKRMINHPYRVPCWRFLFSNLTIQSNGDIPICGLDLRKVNVLASVRQRSIAEVWNTEVRQAQSNHLNLDFSSHPLCQNCFGSKQHFAI
jgi:MoaA/NifB/PqqE/SkfB family radical SAM enzyme